MAASWLYFVRRSVSIGVAICRARSDKDKPIVFEPKSRPKRRPLGGRTSKKSLTESLIMWNIVQRGCRYDKTGWSS